MTDAEQTPLRNLDKLKETILKDYDRLGLEDRFQFACHDKVACFNQCCGDVNIFLTPYDVLRMKRRLGMDSTEFLERYTMLPIEKNMRYPVVMLKLSDAEGKACQFVGPEGCSIYEDRPWPCRMYPLGLASPKDGAAGKPFFFLMKEEVCQGFAEKREWTVEAWLKDQQVQQYDEFGELYKQLTLHDWFARGQQLSPHKMEMFYTATYDLDRFRRFVLDSSFLKRFEVEDRTVAAIRDSDEELLRFGFRWLRFALFGEPTLQIRPEAKGPTAMPRG